MEGVYEYPRHLTGRKAHQITTAHPEAHRADPMSKPTSAVMIDNTDVGTRENA